MYIMYRKAGFKREILIFLMKTFPLMALAGRLFKITELLVAPLLKTLMWSMQSPLGETIGIAHIPPTRAE